MTPEQERTFLQQVSMGAYPSQAALKVGVQPSAISMRKKRDPGVRAQAQEAEASAEFGMYAEVRMSKDPKLILELMAGRWPERWAKAEIRAELTALNIDQDEYAKSMLAGLDAIAARWAPRNALDEEDTLELPKAAEPDGPPAPGVTRS
jgi:hypothetical protein